MSKTIPNIQTPIETATILADRFKKLRLQTGYKRSTLAKRSGVTESSLKRFESSGQISLKNLLRLAQSIGRLEEFSHLFVPAEATSLSELKALHKKTPKRGNI